MRFTDAIRWGLYDRLLATLSFVAGLALAVGGLWIGTSGWLVSALSGDPGATPGGTDAAIALGGVLLGLFVWQVGSAAARHRTMVTATKREVGGREAVADAEAAPSDEADRLAQLENDVEEVRRVAARIEQSMRTDQYEADGLDGGRADAGTGGGAGGAASGAGAAGGAAGASADSSTTDADETASEPAAPEIEFSDEPADEGSADAGTASADGANEAVGDGGAVEDAGATDDAAASDDAVVDDGAGSDDGADADDGAGSDDAAADDGFEWPEEEEEEYYRNT